MLCTGLFLIGLDVTVMNVALPSLQSALDPGPQGLLWIADAYTLALACCLLVAGVWSDTHGRRRAFTLGLALCGAASVAGGGVATVIAVTPRSNRQKADKDVTQWLPIEPARCRYVTEWVAVKRDNGRLSSTSPASAPQKWPDLPAHRLGRPAAQPPCQSCPADAAPSTSLRPHANVCAGAGRRAAPLRSPRRVIFRLSAYGRTPSVTG